jgi:hypothetical protein
MSAGRIGLVGCVKRKLAHGARAKDLYTSALFRGRRAWVERTCDRWFILSAQHGVVAPDTWLAPYDRTLMQVRQAERRAWSGRILDALMRELGRLGGKTFEVHAGTAYRTFGLAEGLERAGATVVVPAAGLLLGQQLRLYREAAQETVQSSPLRRRSRPSSL